MEHDSLIYSRMRCAKGAEEHTYLLPLRYATQHPSGLSTIAQRTKTLDFLHSKPGRAKHADHLDPLSSVIVLWLPMPPTSARNGASSERIVSHTNHITIRALIAKDGVHQLPLLLCKPPFAVLRDTRTRERQSNRQGSESECVNRMNDEKERLRSGGILRFSTWYTSARTTTNRANMTRRVVHGWTYLEYDSDITRELYRDVPVAAVWIMVYQQRQQSAIFLLYS